MKTRDEIRNEYMVLMKKVVEGDTSRSISESFNKLHQDCSHQYGEFNYEIGCWLCPDCCLEKQGVVNENIS